jgi:Antimicrobial peptide resistance and lipid A acylation protein PagP
VSKRAPLFSTRNAIAALIGALAFLSSPSSAQVVSTAAAVAPPAAPARGAVWKHLGDIVGKGGYELYLPVYTYHMPYAYTEKLLRSYNDNPYGAGLGKGRYNERGNWEGLYVMEFADSHGKPEYEGGYAWLATWHPFDNRFRSGAGYTAFITARSDYSGYMPFPGVLPVGSVGYLNADLQCTFVPGMKNNGNVLFTWLKLSFY